jgi:hypothetical protein
LHAEKLLVGARALELYNDPTALASYRNDATRAVAAIYTERYPCPGCRQILDVALRPNEIVYYTVPYAGSAQMTAALSALIEAAADEHSDRVAAESDRRALYPGDTGSERRQ